MAPAVIAPIPVVKVEPKIEKPMPVAVVKPVIEKPVVKNGQIVVGNTMVVTLACDHRTVDGATGAQFLQTFKAFMENSVTMLA